MAGKQEQGFLDLMELSRLLGIPSSIIRKMVRDGVLPKPIQVANKQKRWTTEDVKGIAYLIELMGANRIKTPEERPEESEIDPDEIRKQPKEWYRAEDRRVYFLQESLMGAIKIGSSRSPKKRMMSLRTACPYPLVMLGTIPGGVPKEIELHIRFADKRLNGEWFSKDIAQDVTAILVAEAENRHGNTMV